MTAVKTIVVGGFLGAGKTTLLAQAAGELARRGKRVGLLTNDQAPNLVDTAYLRQQGFNVGEVCGGCFCCQFEKFVLASHQLLDAHAPDVLLAEPVGSCTDISATVLQPLKQMSAHRFSLAPFSVVLDPLRLREALQGGSGKLAGSVNYIYDKQVEEADLIILNKADLLTADEIAAHQRELAARRPEARLFTVSALRGDGVSQWLDYVLQAEAAGKRLAQVDYDTYAAGEAALGWLNASVELCSVAGADWQDVATRLFEKMQAEFRARNAEVAHLKILLTAFGGSLAVNLTSSAGQPSFRVEGKPQRSFSAQLLLNARVQGEPQMLRAVFETAVQAATIDDVACTVKNLECFSPARPQPTHRFTQVVV